MDYLKEGIGLRAMAQRDPLVEYQREGFALWNTMNEAVKEESVGLLFHVDVQVDQPAEAAPAVAPVHVSEMFGGLAGGGATADSDAAPSPVQDDVPDAVAASSGGAPADGVQDTSGAAAAEAAPKVEVSGVGVGRPRTGALHYTAPSESGGVEERDERSPASASALTDDQLRTTPKNSPCPCGSGKKFKMCHGRR
ncbi:SEC-C metal-binding domain-containing protein, partial [Ornithinibacter sp.]|uniref:SEC-C metal-binding domain-containing protein n=1 Tax=Ornithinibacter sp. TaxID=2862748 RepID=UPI002CD87968